MKSASKIGMISLAILTMMIGAGLAHAGYTQTNELVISGTTTGFASGSLHDVRVSADPAASIACVVATTPSANHIYCWAVDSTHTMKSCTATGAAATRLAPTVSGITDETILEFYWDANATCTQINVFHGSAGGD
jgi:hypothetical protein